MHTKRWLIPPTLTPEADKALLAFPPVLRQVLFNRGYATDADARTFLKAEPAFDTDPFQMTGMRAAVERICYALKNKEPIAIYGDYDVDGVASITLTCCASQWCGCLGDCDCMWSTSTGSGED